MSLIIFKPIDNVTGKPIAGVLLSSIGGPGPWQAVSDGQGICRTNLSPGDYTITFSKIGYVSHVLPAHLEDPGTIVQGLDPLSAKLNVRGRDFVDASGKIVKVNGCDGFLDFRLFLDGGEPALAPFVEETLNCGFNARRVFMQGSIKQNGVLQLDPKEPGYYSSVYPFVQYMNGHGILPILTIGVDNQDILSPIPHWANIDNLTQGTDRIISFFNEWSKNKSNFGPADIPPATGLWSRGSDIGDMAPPKPTGPVLEFHPVRGYETAMRDTVASPIELFEVQKYQGALLIDEPGRMGTNAHDVRFTDPRAVYEYSRALSVLCAGAVMHNYFGQRGQLMDSLTLECAKAWTRGMTV